ncbi:MAG: glycosyltransferase family 4 protein [Clostridia bacterium]|nr:glycosyltransferase family 4 protein [Clostridia bacterium]
MDILVVSQFYYPDEFRVNDITRRLAADGHTVHVLTGLPDYATGRVPQEYRRGRRRRETVDGVDIIRVPIVARRQGMIFRMLNYLSFVVSGKLYARFMKLKPDVVFSYETSPVLQVMPAITAAKRRRVPLIIYCCDIWPECLKVWGIKESSLLFRYIKRLSRRIFNKGDRVAITSEPFREYLQTVNEVPAEKIVLLPQHAEDTFGEVAGVYEENGCTDFVFAGNIGAAQSVDTIVRAAAALGGLTDKPWQVHIVGDGTARLDCEDLARQLGVTDRVIFHGKHPLQEMVRFYKLADCFLLTMSGNGVGNATLPAKWQGYISAGKPIAVSADGVCADMTALVDCGCSAPADDGEALAAVMKQMMDNPARCREQGLKGRRYYEENSTIDIFMERLYALLDESMK